MPKFQLLLLDAGVIIAAHELGIWSRLINKCTISITRTVLEQVTYYWRDERDNPYQIDLSNDIVEQKIQIIDVPLDQVKIFRLKFDPTYLDRMDPGETDSLAYLCHASEQWLILSGDGFVFRILGRLARSDQGISLEEILEKIGLGRAVKWQFTKEFRLKYTKQGEQDSITGQGLK